MLVGSSLVNAAVAPALFEKATGTRVVQLAVNGGRAYSLLEDLARDRSFKGTVICELIEGEIADEKTASVEKEFIKAYRQETPARRGESSLQRFVQARFAFTSPQLSLRALVDDALNGRSPVAHYPHFSIGPDRTLYVDFGRADVARLRARAEAAPHLTRPDISPDEFVARAGRFETLAGEIEGRGGWVVFVRPPFSGVAWERTESVYPKAAYWDEFARRTRFRTIHFKDYEGLQPDCPDYVHLDERDAPRFTEALADIIVKNDWLCCRNR